MGGRSGAMLCARRRARTSSRPRSARVCPTVLGPCVAPEETRVAGRLQGQEAGPAHDLALTVVPVVAVKPKHAGHIVARLSRIRRSAGAGPRGRRPSGCVRQSRRPNAWRRPLSWRGHVSVLPPRLPARTLRGQPRSGELHPLPQYSLSLHEGARQQRCGACVVDRALRELNFGKLKVRPTSCKRRDCVHEHSEAGARRSVERRAHRRREATDVASATTSPFTQRVWHPVGAGRDVKPRRRHHVERNAKDISTVCARCRSEGRGDWTLPETDLMKKSCDDMLYLMLAFLLDIL